MWEASETVLRQHMFLKASCPVIISMIILRFVCLCLSFVGYPLVPQAQTSDHHVTDQGGTDNRGGGLRVAVLG